MLSRELIAVKNIALRFFCAHVSETGNLKWFNARITR